MNVHLDKKSELQQCLPLAVCDEGCEAAEEQSDDEDRTSLVPDQRENKTDGATVPTACGIETNIYKETYDLHRASDIVLKDLHKKGRLIYEKRE